MTHLFQPRTPFYKSPAFALAVTAALVLWMLFGATSCRDQDPLPTPDEMIRGAWSMEWTPADATTNYSFDGRGQCIAYAILPAKPVQNYNYAYYFEGDVLTMIDLASADPFRDFRRAAVSFPTDTTCVLAWEHGVDYHLTRL